TSCAWPCAGAVCTAPVPASSVTWSPTITGTCFLMNGCSSCRCSSCLPVNCASTWPLPRPYRARQASRNALASTSTSECRLRDTQTATYSMSGPSDTASLAGSVQGVVVQMTSDTGCAPITSKLTPTRCAKSAGSATRNATSIAGELLSSYSTSASASEERQSRHQWTGL